MKKVLIEESLLRAILEAMEDLHRTGDTQVFDMYAAPELIPALRQALSNEALNKMAQNAREIGLDYEPSAGTQVSKVWRDGGKLVAKQVPLEDFYKPAQQEPVKSGEGASAIVTITLPAQQEPVAMQVRPSEFAQIIKGKEKVTGIPAYWAEWPSKEQP